MKVEDFSRYGITNFTPQEIIATGARVEDVQLVTMQAIQRFRTAVRRSIFIPPGGLTSGDHVSKEHSLGLAIDVRFSPADGTVDNWALFRAYMYEGIKAGFSGVGIYWNGSMYSFHFDFGAIRMWAGVKKTPGAGEWAYKTILNDPRTLV